MSVAQILNLGLRLAVEAVIALAVVALLVLPLAVGDAAACQDEYADLACQIDGVALVVFWRVDEGVCPVGVLVVGKSKR